jgi:hypothetical protein
MFSNSHNMSWFSGRKMSWANLHSPAFGFGSAVDSREYQTRFHSYRVSEIA